MPDVAHYDLNVILDPGLSDAQLETEKGAVDTQIERAGGTIVGIDELGHQRLAYPIRKQSEGYYLIYRLDLPNDTPKVVEAALRQRDNVMRVLAVKDRPEWKTRKAPQETEAPIAQETPAQD
jgi:small subunit ribosomal protein S6